MDGAVVAADVVVIAMGPWTSMAAAWLPGVPATTGLKYHSVVLRPQGGTGAAGDAPPPIGNDMLFTSFTGADGAGLEEGLGGERGAAVGGQVYLS